MRTIFAKIFVWFWLSTAAVTLSILVINTIGGLQPVRGTWLNHTVDLYAKSSVDFYLHGGKPLLQTYLDDAAKNSGLQAALIDPQGNDILGQGLPSHTERVLSKARTDHESQFLAAPFWTGAAVVHTAKGDFILVAHLHPLKSYWTRRRTPGILRWVFALLSVGFFCWLIARHITAPIRTLQNVARRISAGDLTARASPTIPPRNDELADLARDFDRMADRIQSLIQKQQELLGDISHELRSPLTRLSVSLELARRGDSEAIERMQVDVEQIHLLIEQILTLTRLELQQNMKFEDFVNLRTILASVAEDANFEGRNAGKSVAIPQADECWINGSANLLRSCIENIVRNAIRYTAPQTSVEISLLLDSGSPAKAHLTVQDRGPGVPPEALPRLFEPFYRVSEARERESGGSGLGLSIAQKVVVLHGGVITARNREGGGLIVEIHLPVSSRTREEALAQIR